MAKSTSASPQRIPQLPKTQSSNISNSKRMMVPVRESNLPVPANNGDVRDGKFFHIRLKLSYLSALSVIQLFSRDGGDESMASTSRWSEADNSTVYAAIETGELHDSNLKYSVSLPLNPSMNKQLVHWPKAQYLHDPTNSSSGRLYHTVLLRTDGGSAEQNNSEDGSTSTTNLASPSIYAPKLVNILLGLMRGGTMVPLGVASLEVNGQDVDDLKMDLPVRPISFNKNSESGKKKGSPMKSFRNFLGVNKRKKEVPVSKNTTYTPEATFPGDDKLYKIPDNTTLRVRLDIMDGIYDSNGPVLWGDLEDDAESFRPPVVELTDDGQVDLSNTYSHESIEVMNDKLGTTILSSPGSQFAAAADDDDTVTCTFIAPSNHTESTNNLRAGDDFSAMYAPGGLCGVMDDFNSSNKYIDTNYSFASTLPDIDDYDEIRYPISLPPALMSAMSRLTEHVSEEEEMTVGEGTSECTARTSSENHEAALNENDTDEGSSNVSAGTDSKSQDIDTVDLEAMAKARATLQRYASQLGVEIEDLLDDESESQN
jgi:hypothetical protein